MSTAWGLGDIETCLLEMRGTAGLLVHLSASEVQPNPPSSAIARRMNPATPEVCEKPGPCDRPCSFGVEERESLEIMREG
jgi:hypothetical protein